MTVIIFILLFIAACGKILSDTVDHEDIFNSSRLAILGNYRHWVKAYTSENKYKYVAGVKMERFPLSSTLFVGVTDPWHFGQMVIFVSLTFVMVLLMKKGPIVQHFDSEIIDYFANYALLRAGFIIPFHCGNQWIRRKPLIPEEFKNLFK